MYGSNQIRASRLKPTKAGAAGLLGTRTVTSSKFRSFYTGYCSSGCYNYSGSLYPSHERLVSLQIECFDRVLLIEDSAK